MPGYAMHIGCTDPGNIRRLNDVGINTDIDLTMAVRQALNLSLEFLNETGSHLRVPSYRDAVLPSIEPMLAANAGELRTQANVAVPRERVRGMLQCLAKGGTAVTAAVIKRPDIEMRV